MLFTSPFFLYLFLPLVLFCYYLVPKRFKNLTLLFFSLGFYAFGERELVLLIIVSAIIDFSCGLLIAKGYRKLGLYASIGFNLGILMYFKYSNFLFSSATDALSYWFHFTESQRYFFANVVLPLGISFYTFQTMSYTIDVYRGQVKATRNFIDFITYVSLFPQLIAGPIVRFKDVQHDLQHKELSYSKFADGVQRFVIGLAKKVIIANNCAFVVDGIFSLPPEDMSALAGWLGVIMYSLQIYYDFSGYSDMAIGLGKMLGFNFPENFNFPYISKSIREFWQRWHMTLSNWFKDYLYIPLGGNRVTQLRNLFNLSFVFFITGLWHGAQWTFVIWGLFHGGLILLEKAGLEKALNKLPAMASHVYVFLGINLSWVLFRSDTISDAMIYYHAMFDFSRPINLDFLNFFLSKELIAVSIIGSILALPKPSIALKKWLDKRSVTSGYFKPVVYVLILILVTFYISIDNYNPFIYFRF